MNLENDNWWNRGGTQKQPFANVFQNWCSLKFRDIYNFIKETPTQVFFYGYCEIFTNSFFVEHLRWLLLVTAINRSYSDTWLLQNSKDNILYNSILVDMKVCALQLKQKSSAGVSSGILRNFRTATFENIFWGCFWKERRKACSFHYFQGSYLSHETIS